MSFTEPPDHKKPIQPVLASGRFRIHTKRVFACARGAPSSGGAERSPALVLGEGAEPGDATAAGVIAAGAAGARELFRVPVR